MDRVLVLLLVLAATGAVSAWWRARDGRVTSNVPGPAAGASTTDGAERDTPGVAERYGGLPVEAADLAAAVGSTTPLTLVEFTAPNCQPCAATRRMLDEAIVGREDVTVATIDVGDALDLARAHRIMRAPTTLLISAEGHLLGRVAGVPRREELNTLLDATQQHARAA